MTFLRVSYQSKTGKNGDITFVFRALHEAVTFPVFGTDEHISASVGDIPERPHLAMIFAVPYNSGGVCPESQIPIQDYFVIEKLQTVIRTFFETETPESPYERSVHHIGRSIPWPPVTGPASGLYPHRRNPHRPGYAVICRCPATLNLEQIVR